MHRSELWVTMDEYDEYGVEGHGDAGSLVHDDR